MALKQKNCYSFSFVVFIFKKSTFFIDRNNVTPRLTRKKTKKKIERKSGKDLSVKIRRQLASFAWRETISTVFSLEFLPFFLSLPFYSFSRIFWSNISVFGFYFWTSNPMFSECVFLALPYVNHHYYGARQVHSSQSGGQLHFSFRK